MRKEYVDSLLAKLGDDSRLMTLEELRYLKSVFDSFEGRIYIEEKFVSVIDSVSDEPYDYDFDSLYARIEKQIRRQSKRPLPLRRIVRTAAAVVMPLLAAGGIWLYTYGPGSARMNTIARVEDKVRLFMPDGTEIVLDRTGGNARISEQKDVALLRQDGSLVIEKRADAVPEETGRRYGTLCVPRGERFDLVLEDGTRVWLNSDSRLRFPPVFTGGERRIYLEGEAYFEVTRDPARPFIVETPGQQLRVLGTSFNVSAYPNDGATFTTLVEGRIALQPQGGGEELILRPGQQARLDADTEEFSTAEVNTGHLTSWRSGLFVFEGNTLEQVMRQLARWYDMEYTFADPQAKEMVLRGIMPVQAEVAGIFEILETSGRVRFLIDDNKVTVKAIK